MIGGLFILLISSVSVREVITELYMSISRTSPLESFVGHMIAMVLLKTVNCLRNENLQNILGGLHVLMKNLLTFLHIKAYHIIMTNPNNNKFPLKK